MDFDELIQALFDQGVFEDPMAPEGVIILYPNAEPFEPEVHYMDDAAELTGIPVCGTEDPTFVATTEYEDVSCRECRFVAFNEAP